MVIDNKFTKEDKDNAEKTGMESVYNYYKGMYRVEWVPNEDFSEDGVEIIKAIEALISIAK
ncbi:hypothetical protein [Butyrivibrio sp. M55]|uniref:hypothetical protein n=1 Tax=Butyrivibrio sp. M55 TaxID=1855323 RepID=UPI0008E29C4D|nr:hypothetical protein [Butyrivibrio sp. M55]SFU44611.1 hypothetical protein SAMN05216540_102189 [Butyrivibrio sp. M55]